MPHIAVRRFMGMGERYAPGDLVPLDKFPEKAATHLVAYKMVRQVDSLPAKSGKDAKGGR